MKEIMFRGKCLGTNDWAYGSLIIKRNEFYIGYISDVSGIWSEIQVEPKTVGQYTGLKDKNGKEIYEKDVVDIHGQKLIVHLGNHAYDTRDLLVGGLFREVYGFYLESPCGSWEVNIAVVVDNVEVIGNIYKNPELLEVN
ncbi:YopX family protein [Lysinibacillus sp. M3]|uniref:YopX family protein n=1 Tax=Lysinibacillus zambalensis TaxID=3160866 RepID=A0ABV1MRK8_9BACI